MNGMVAGMAITIAIVTLGLTCFLLLAVLSGSASGGPGMAGGGGYAIAMALVTLLFGSIVSLGVVLPLGIWSWLIARWLWRGDARGRQHLWWLSGLTLIVSVMTIGWAAVATREPLGHYVLSMPVFAWALFQILVLFRSRIGEVH
jgi:hypothetical protein